MLNSLSIKNFRGIDQLTINPLGRVNLIAGKNGTGKTTVLESLWILSAPDVPELAVRVSAFRGLPPSSPETIFEDLFNGFNTQELIEISGESDSGSKLRKLKISLKEHTSSTAELQRYFNPAESGGERSTQLQSEGQFELVFDYLHDDGNKYSSRAWWIEHTVSPLPQVPVQLAVTNAGVHQEREQVPGRPDSVFMGALYRSSLEEDSKRFGIPANPR